MATTNILLAGFGGQGILFAGKFLAYKGLLEGKQVSWLPSYGPEMRGGTANCSVITSDEPIGSPIVSSPDVLVAMNLPSLDKYEDSVLPGGMIFVDSSLIKRKVKRTDVKVFYTPATQAATDNGTPTLANMVIMGRVLKEMDCEEELLQKTLERVVPHNKADLLAVNQKVINIGKSYGE